MKYIQKQCVYILNSQYFKIVNDPEIMDKERRPYYCSHLDKKTGYYVMIPLSSQIDKAEKEITKKINKYGSCNNIMIVKYGGYKEVVLLQNLVLCPKELIYNRHSISFQEIKLNDRVAKLIQNNAEKLIGLYRLGYSTLFTNIVAQEKELDMNKEKFTFKRKEYLMEK